MLTRILLLLVPAVGLAYDQDKIDWQLQFQQGSDPDEHVVAASRERAGLIAERVCHEASSDLEQHVREVAPFLQSQKPAVQLQASGLYGLLTICRSDAGEVVGVVQPELIRAALDQTMAERSRANCLIALASIKPILPNSLFPLFKSIFDECVHKRFGRLIEPSAVGLSRLASSYPEAILILHRFLRQSTGADYRGQVVAALGQTQTDDKTLIEDLGYLLDQGDLALSSQVIRTIAILDTRAIEINESQLRRFIKHNPGTETAKMAESLLQHH